MRTLDELKKLQPEDMDLEELDYMICLEKEVCDALGKTVGRLEISNQALVQAGYYKVEADDLFLALKVHSKIVTGLEREVRLRLED